MSDAALPVVAFTKDWNDVPTSTTHVLRAMGKVRPVLWISSIGVRKPSLGSGRDLSRIWGRGKRVLTQRFEHKENQLSVLSPVVIPRPTSSLAIGINRFVLGGLVRRQLRRMGAAASEFWTFVPSAVDYAGCLNERKLVYYCVDDWSYMHGVDTTWIDACEERLLKRASIVFATSRFLVEKCRRHATAEVHYLSHGVDHAKFARALSPELPVPAELAGLPRPIVGFYGNLVDRIDFPLISRLTKRRRDWSFVFIGPIVHDVGDLPEQPNVHMLGRREHDQLPACCKAFDAAWIPYDMTNPLNQAVNPIKARELLAAGVPLVTSCLPEMADLGDAVLNATTDDEWEAALATQLQRRDRQAISASVAGEDWSAKIDHIRALVDAAPVVAS